MITLSTSDLQLVLHHPEDGFYQGTRFDRSGVFDSLLFRGTELCGRWFTEYDPLMHDAVCGPTEEFSPVFLGPGQTLKTGVGILEADEAGYDHFKLYPVLDAGEWTVEEGEGRVLFRHHLKGIYTYEKEIALTGEASFSIAHTLRAEKPLQGDVYNHNFFTFGHFEVGPDRRLDFPFLPEGDWREPYDSVDFMDSGIRFTRKLREGESVYTGNIHEAGGQGMPYRMSMGEGSLAVHISGSVPVLRTAMWANHRIACLEPFNAFQAAPDFSWTLSYQVVEIPNA